MLLCLGPAVPLPPLNAGLTDKGCLLGTLRTPGPLCGVKRMGYFSLKSHHLKSLLSFIFSSKRQNFTLHSENIC